MGQPLFLLPKVSGLLRSALSSVALLIPSVVAIQCWVRRHVTRLEI